MTSVFPGDTHMVRADLPLGDAPSASVLPPLSRVELLKPKVAAVWSALEARYAEEITGGEVDHLLACYVFGLTTPLYGTDNPAVHFAICCDLVEAVLPQERADRALTATPAITQSWVGNAFQSVEQLGRKDGAALLAAMPSVSEPNHNKN